MAQPVVQGDAEPPRAPITLLTPVMLLERPVCGSP